MTKYMKVPFSIDSSGAVATHDSEIETIKQYLACLLLTTPKERVMRPTYGSDLVNDMFDTFRIVQSQAGNQISSAVAQWLPDVSIEKVDIIDDTVISGEVRIHLAFSYRGRPTEVITVTRGELMERQTQ